MNIKYEVFEMPKFKAFKMDGPRRVFENYKDYGKADREMFLVLHLNSKNMVIDSEIQSVGTVDSATVYPREILKSVLLKSSTCIIIVHNHPSGDPAPSDQDNEITRQIVFACRVLGVTLLDHVVVGRDTYYSYANEGKIEDYEFLYKSLNIGGQE